MKEDEGENEESSRRKRDGASVYHSLPNRSLQNNSNNHLARDFAGVIGNVLEWYDFAIFGFFSDIFGDVFFPPNQEGHAAIVESFAVFGGAFLMRPIGGLIMGYIGDTQGRKKALELSIFLMAFPTFAMGCLPTYQQVGPLAYLLLIVVRLLQGFSVGGQLMSSLVFTLENKPRDKWGLYGSYVMAGANLGTLLGGIVAFLMRRYMDEEALSVWGWRVPFLAGILVSFSGIYLKFYCEDDAIEEEPRAATQGARTTTTTVSSPENPIFETFRISNCRSLASAVLVPMIWSSGFYLTFVWMAVFMAELVDPPIPGAFGINSASLFGSLCLLWPFAGIISDIYGRTLTMSIGGIGMAILSPIMIHIIASGSQLAAFFAQSTLGITLSLYGAPMCAWLAESFPPHQRLTSVAVGYNTAQAIVGGLSPALATRLVDFIGPESPGYYLSFISVLSLFGLLCVAPSKVDVQDDDDAFLDTRYVESVGVQQDVEQEGECDLNGEGQTGELT